MKKNLVLIGMMGSGKSTIGKEISKKSTLKFKDTDKLIEIHEKMKIRDIFDEKGEKFFRSIEEKIVLQTIKLPGQVIAVGGGSFLNNKIRYEIFKNSISFWLNWKNEIILNRIINSKKRPKLDFLSDRDINRLINLRSKIYIKANYKVNCDNLSKFQITKKILKIYENKKNIS
ncbi:MAG: shikimate kinase [Candidatus Pelagibacter sp.]